MNLFIKIVSFLQSEMERPTSYGAYHIFWICIVIAFTIYFIVNKKYTEKKLKVILGTYGIVAFILEVSKQIFWNIEINGNSLSFNYAFYAFPFQLCTTPIFISLICLFMKKGKVRDYLLSFMAYITILGSLATFLYPESCFVKTILINIHTMYLHCGSLILSLYLIISGEVKPVKKNLLNGYLVFIIFVIIAMILNISIYHSGILGDETFNMFFISPYFTSTLPGYDFIQTHTPYILYLIIYLVSIFIGEVIIYGINKLIKRNK